MRPFRLVRTEGCVLDPSFKSSKAPKGKLQNSQSFKNLPLDVDMSGCNAIFQLPDEANSENSTGETWKEPQSTQLSLKRN